MANPVQVVENLADNSTTVDFAYGGNITSGNLLTLEITSFSAVAITAGQLTKVAGTATIGTIALDDEQTDGTATAVAIFSIPVTGTGSCTLRFTGSAGGYYWGNTSEWEGLQSTKETSNSATGSSATADSGNVTSAAGAVFVGVAGTNQTNADTYTADGAYTVLNEEEGGATHQTGQSAYKTVGTGNTDSFTSTLGGSHVWCCCAVVYAAAAGGPSAGTDTATAGLTESLNTVTVTLSIQESG